jgi:leader peptidase (prepilin peptidase) / N-methyltransferase
MTSADFFASLGAIYLFAVAWPLSRIDIREHRLPNRLVLPAFPIALVGLAIAAVISSRWLDLALTILAASIAFAVGLLVNRFGSLGMGDVKLIAATTLSIAWFNLLAPIIALVLGLVLASAVILVQLIRGRTNLQSEIALGPYLLAGFVSTQILTWSSYLGGFSPNVLT